MSVTSLRTQIKEDYLTCPICCNDFTKPKALPCIHTFCESCLRDYVASRGFESAVAFPCPICRTKCPLPARGVEGFPNNHLMSSLSDTVEKSDSTRPVPKPRRSFGVAVPPSSQVDPGTSVDSPQTSCPNRHWPTVPVFAPGVDDFEIVEWKNKGSSVDNSPPPPYSSVADSKLCSNDVDPGWMLVPKQNPPASNPNSRGDSIPVSYPSFSHSSAVPVAPISWNSSNQNSQTSWNLSMSNGLSSASQISALYPCVPPNLFESNTACAENLILRFGKQGSSARDFIKPVGLAISQDGQYIISDNGGDQNRIMIFKSDGEITRAFKCGAKLIDIAVTGNNEIVASIDKNVSAFRLFTMGGQLKGEFGKFFTFEKPSGIAELTNQGIVLTGIEGNCVYALTPQMKLSTKFGRKGNGDGYFLHPGFVAVNSKNHVIVTDKLNGCVQVFSCEGKFKQRFGSNGQKNGQLREPLGVCVDLSDNIIVADSGNCRVEVFTSSGRWLNTIVKDTNQLGEGVSPVNVAFTPTGKVAVLLRGPYFAEVRVYSSRHQLIPQEGHVSVAGIKPSVWYM